jgi:hypothetical protein
MATRRHGNRIVGHIIDAGTYGENPDPGGEWYITEDGRKLTPEEAFRRVGEPVGPAGRKGMSRASTAAAIAMAFYHAEEGIDVNLAYSETAVRIATYASEHGLPGADLLDPEGGTMRGLIQDMVIALKAESGRLRSK